MCGGGGGVCGECVMGQGGGGYGEVYNFQVLNCIIRTCAYNYNHTIIIIIIIQSTVYVHDSGYMDIIVIRISVLHT